MAATKKENAHEGRAGGGAQAGEGGVEGDGYSPRLKSRFDKEVRARLKESSA